VIDDTTKESISGYLKRVRQVIDEAVEEVKQNAKNNQVTYCIRSHAYAADVMYCVDEDGWVTVSVLISKANDHNFCRDVWLKIHEHELFTDVGNVEIRSEW